ncbi:MAG: nuclear transport factor 2 family protein [Candidatus Kapabacteria bacterium]|nr:nuclear transport factor 2 family protein [Candidatus Kapabacteria bacterium]
MNSILGHICLIFLASISVAFAQPNPERTHVERACLDYIEGFYEGDTVKIIRSLRPTLHKFGFWKSEKTGKYENDGQMTFEQAVKYANNVRVKQRFAKADAPKKVEVLDIMNHIASAKITAWWGTDYILLSKNGESWMINQVLWEGPLEVKKQP